MLPVSSTQIEEYNANSIHKTLRVYFPHLNVTVLQKNIEGESFQLTESILDGKNVEFVGCIASEMRITIYQMAQTLKNESIEVYVKTDDTAEIPLFKGTVYSAVTKRSNGKRKIDIIAYDTLYTIGQKDVASWYQGLTFPKTIKQIRDSLFTYLGVTQETVTLPNDNISIAKQYDPTVLQCLNVIKGICQFNGCFGIMNRSGNFEYRFIEPDSYQMIIANEFTFAKSVESEDYYVKPFERVQIRDSEKDAGITVGDGTAISNKYIIQANMWAYKLDDNTKTTVATNIYNVVKGIAIYPCNTNNNGLPFLEVGDRVKYTLTNTRSASDLVYNTFLCTHRVLKGVQALRDTYKADGDEEASEFVSDLQTQIDTIKQSGGGGIDPDDYYTKEETEDYVDTAISTETQTIISVVTLPVDRDENTVYLTRGDVTIM